jgi:hypothetical protein
MGFEPQTAGQPLVNPRKRTTKVNFAVAAGVLLFLVIGIGYTAWVSHHKSTPEPPRPASDAVK